MNSREVRKIFLDYFQEKGHRAVPSSSVIPHGDRTLLFTNAGMNQFKDIFTGRVNSPYPRAATVQKCIRAGGKHNDLEHVGSTSRHLTFFEMLGNFSFGDYFKKEAIELAWELVTRRLKVAPERLWFTVYREDEEARELWRRVAGAPSERIVGLGESENYWSMGEVGPCGPCSEILVDRGADYGAATVENGERFFEIWNLVFMQFDQRPDGKKVPLPRPCIDTGMGLERMVMVLQGASSVFETDILHRLIARVEEITGVRYSAGPDGVAHRVIADHVRSLVFAFADGAEPSNEGRGYVLRRILRRAARYGRKIHQGGPLLHFLVEALVEEMGDAFPEIEARKGYITELIRSEEERFGETLDKGIQLFEETAARLKGEGRSTIPGSDVFKLYDTFGFPVDLVEIMAKEGGLDVDLAGFKRLMQDQKERSRGASLFHVGADATAELALERLPETRFLGYERTDTRSEIQAVARGPDWLRVVLSETPFYAESGGQVGDTGSIVGEDFRLEVLDTQKERGRFIHSCRLVDGDPARVLPAQLVEAAVDQARRTAIKRNHTATHLLHAALRSILGTHVHQKGSLVGPERLRFDVTHFVPMKSDELVRVECLVIEEILRNAPVETFETDYQDAVKRGALALFGEKYGERVRVVKIGDFSLELCGGTHVERTGELGAFLVAGEGSVSAGVRRLEALTANAADSFHRRHLAILTDLSRLLKAQPETLVERVEKLLAENRELRKGGKGALGPSPQAGNVRREVVGKGGNTVFLSVLLDSVDGKALREAYDRVKREAEEVVAVVISLAAGKPVGSSRVELLVGVSPSLVGKGLDAREVFNAAADRLSARGGGRPELVQGAGTGGAADVEKAVEAMLGWVRSRSP